MINSPSLHVSAGVRGMPCANNNKKPNFQHRVLKSLWPEGSQFVFCRGILFASVLAGAEAAPSSTC